MANSLEITSHGYLSTILKHSYLRLIDTMTIVDDISPSVSTSTKNNQQLQQYELICAYSASGSHVAFAMNHNLTIGKINFKNSETLNNCSDEIIDLEFEANILIICWDIKERCLIIADDGGNLHFVTSKGQILFSKKITTAHSNCDIVALSMIDSQQHFSSIICFLENGGVFAVDQIPIDDFCSSNSPQSLGKLLQQLKFSKFSTPYQAPTKTLIYSFNQRLQAILLDQYSRLHLLDLGSASSLVVTPIYQFPEAVKYVDISLIPHQDGCYALILTENQNISLFDLVEQTELCSTNLGGVVSPLLTNLNSILSTSILSNSDEMPCLSFSIICISDQDDQNQELDNRIHSYLILNNRTFIYVDTTTLCLADSEVLPYPIGSYNSKTTSSLFAAWSEKNELSILSHSDMVSSILAKISSSFASLRDTLANSEDIDTGNHLQLHDDGLSTIGYLLCTNLPSFLINKFLQSFQHLSSSEILLILKLILQHSSCDGDCYINGLLSAQQILESDPDSGEYLEELQIFLNAFLTTLECNWEFNPNVSQQTTVTKRLFDDEKTTHEISSTHSSVLSYQSLIGTSASQQSWEFCLRNGLLNASSVILSRLLNHKLPRSPDIVLNLVNVEVCSISEFIDWIQRDILPSIRENSQSSAKVCEYLTKLTLQIEEKDQHPYNSILISELTLSIASSLLMNYSSSNDLLQYVQTIHSNMSLQVAIWSEWNEHLSYQEITQSQFIGIFSYRIRNLLIQNPVEDIQFKVRPLMNSYDVNFDLMLYQWILETVQKSVILVTDDGPHENENDGPHGNSTSVANDAIHIKRLVAVAESIEIPNYQAKAIICLLQTLSLPHIAVSLETFRTSESTTSNHETIQVCYSRLLNLSHELQGKVSSPIADALAEAFRSYKLRQLAVKYRIKGFNPREPRQVRDAIGLILSKIHVPSSIEDAISFAEGYSTSGVDLSNILVKSLVHRILPISGRDDIDGASDWLDKDNMIRGALSYVPNDRLQIVVEDTCDYLLSLLSDIASSSSEQGLLAGCVEKSLQETFSASASGALIVMNYFLDNAGPNDTVSLDQGEADDSLPKKTSSQYSGPSSSITTEMQNKLKRIKKLIFEFSIYLCPYQLCDSKVCGEILSRTALQRTDEIINHLLNDDTQKGTSEILQLWSTQLLKLRKLCLLLDGSFVSLLSSMMKHCLVKGQMELGMCFAELIAVERKDITQGSTERMKRGLSVPSISFNENEIVINSAITLCGVAAKKAQESGQQKQEKTRRIGRHNYANNESQLFDVTPFALSSELLRLTVLTCGGNSLGKTIDLLNSCELVIDIHKRLEGQNSYGNLSYGGDGNYQTHQISTPGSSAKYPYPLSAFKQTHGWNTHTTDIPGGDLDQKTKSTTSSSEDSVTLQQLQHQISGVHFVRDGILMSPSMIWGPLLRYILMETKRREGSLSTEQIPDDIDKLVTTLQRTENHLLAARVILSTWSAYHGKKQSFYTSMMALGRKIITYRDIDISFAVACLSTIPFDAMVKELKSAVPSIQGDFSRLRTVALIGEQLAQMWQQEDSLLLFQSLQTNAKWWHILSSYGIKIDSRAFQSSNIQHRDECIRGVVPQLLKRTGGDISLAMEYCNQYDLEAHYASTCYIEYILVSKPIQITSSQWSNNIKKVCSSVEERLIIHSLQQILPQIHPLDYEKISFTCKWLIDIISEEDIGDHCNIKDDESDEEDRPQKVAVSSIIMESYRGLVDECTRYLHIATLLINLPISTKMDTLFPDLSSLYESLSSEYHYRLPFWKLISEPWTLLEPLMIVDSEIGPKLAPLCPFLQIERDEFYVKRAIHLYTRCSLQQSTTVLVDSTPLVPSSSSSSTTIPLQLSPQMESLLKDIHDIASCTKKPLTRVKIWRLVYEMEKDRNSHIALKALQTALEVFHQIRLIPTITESEQQQQQYHDMKYEIILEIVKHKSKDILYGMQSYKMTMIRSYESTITPTTTNTTPPPSATATATPSATTCNTHNLWKHILCYESLVMKLTPYLGDINSLLKIFFENLLHEVWVMQCHAIRRTSVILTPYDLLNQKLLPIIIEYIKYAGNVALQLYEIHLALDTNHETKKEEIVSSNATTSATSVLTSSTLQSVRHSMIGKLLADVDIPESENHSRVMKSAAQGTNTQMSGLVNGLWGTISSSDSIASPSSAELRRREDVYRAFSIATLLASCTPSCPSLLLVNQLLAVGKGANNRSQRRLTARSKFRAVQAILFLPQLPQVVEKGENFNEEQLKWLPLLRDMNYLYSLRGYLYCLAELQELRIPCSEETLAYALQHDTNAYSSGTHSGSTTTTKSSELSDQIISLVNTWIHDEGHHSDVCELSRDLLLVSSCWNPQIWLKLISHVLNRNFVRLLFHTLVILQKFSLFSILLSDGYLYKLIADAIYRSSYDITEKLEQMYELLSSRDTTGSEDLTKKLTGENAQEVVHKKIILYCLDSPHSCRNWDESPEDLALISYRLDLTLSKLIVENRFLTTEVSMADYFSLCQRLFTISRRYQEHSLLILNENNDLETSRQCAVEDLLANSSLSLCLSFISHLKPVIQGVMSSKVRLLNRIKVPRENLIPMSQYEEFARNSLQIVFPSTQAHQKLFQIFIRSLVVFASLTSEESLHEILTQLLPIQDSDLKLFEVLYYLGNVHELSSNEMSCSRKVSQIVMKWIQSSDERRMMIHTVWKKMTQDQHKRYSQAFQNWKIWGGDGVEVLNDLLEKEERK